MKEQIKFLKGIDFLDIRKNQVFNINNTIDNTRFIKVGKMNIYLTPMRDNLNYYEYL